MENELKQKLTEMEQKYGVKVLFAAVSGSRAYGLETPTSDYDTHFVFVHPAGRYVSPFRPEDYLSCGEDVNGWELGKFLGMVVKSAYSAFELFNCPVAVKGEENREEFLHMMMNFFLPEKLAYSFCGYAKSEFKKYDRAETEKVRTKAVVSAARMLLSAEMLLLNPTEYPSVNYNKLVECFVKSKGVEMEEMGRKMLLLGEAKRGKEYAEELVRTTREEVLTFLQSRHTELTDKLAEVKFVEKRTGENMKMVETFFRKYAYSF